ncbi:MAG: HD domain-containing protein [Armatimonadetes bacterium]|nr:HD domain-containing protein [Armatimonadota bacterium]
MAWFTRIRDPVHGFVGLTHHEAKLINSQAVQRLRGIKQLAMAHLVYPGALHTRFDHTLGVCHVAGLMAASLDLSNEDEHLVRQAALLHDLGHGPFSHVSESLLDRFCDRDVLDDVGPEEKIHERLTLDVIRYDEELSRLLSQDERDTICRLLGPGYGHPVLRDIVSGPVDADKQDYLLRDSLFCGVSYGVFDLTQLHRSLRRSQDHDNICLVVTSDGVHALEQFVLAKYYLTTQVYRHKVRLITDQMLTRAIALGIEHDKIDLLRDLYRYDGSDEFVRRYVAWDDARFLLTFGGDEFRGTACHALITRLRQRHLLKRVYSRGLNEKEFPNPETRSVLSNISEAQRSEVEDQITAALEQAYDTQINARQVILHVYNIRSVRVQSRNDEKSILVDDRPSPTPFEEKSTLFKSIDERLDDTFVEVYAPVVHDPPDRKYAMINALQGRIDTILGNLTDRAEDEDAAS